MFQKRPMCVVGCCWVLQGVEVRCSACSVLECSRRVSRSVLQGVAGCCRVLQGVAGCCRVLQGVAV